MQNILLLPISIFSFLNCFSQLNEANMFRGNATHNSYAAVANDLVYDTKAWQFFAGAPVRSTPLISNDMIYFGTTKGDFFAIDKKKGQVKWQYSTGMAINSSAASQGEKIFFTDNRQTLFCLNKSTGKKLWEFKMGEKIAYPWRFDYYYSSPVLYEDKLIVGGDDGYLYNLYQRDGKLAWKFKSKGLVRATAAVYNGMVLFGDTEGIFYALDLKTGKEKWVFKVIGEPMKLEEFGYDRKAILAAAVISKGKIVFGARDGYLYCLNATDGKQLWVVDHQVSWVISTVAIKDSFVVTGTSDGRFVQAVNLDSGKEIWKFHPNSLFWSSPLIVNDKVYAGGFDGILYCLDLKSGQRISQFSTGGKILSSPVWDNDFLYVGSDDGNVYALSGHPDDRVAKNELKRFVYYEPGAKTYFSNGCDQRIKNYLTNCGFKAIGLDTLPAILSSGFNTVIVFASAYMPKNILDNGANSLLRKFLDAGGRVVMPGTNSMIFAIDEKEKRPVAFNIPRADSVLGINYGPNDTRTMGGQFSCFPTNKGKTFGLPDFWDASVFLQPDQVDMVLGKNENGLVSAFAKSYKNGGRFVQLYIHPDLPVNLDAIVKLAEWELE